MSDVQVNYTRPGRAQFFDLLNGIATEVLTEESVTIGNPKAGDNGRNTSVDVSVNRYVYKNPKTLYYDRVSVPAVFANQTVVSIRELDLNVDANKPALDAKFFTEFETKYGFKIHAEDFDTTKVDDYTFGVQAKANNLVYTGNISVVIEKSLKTRVPNTVLGGFAAENLVLS